ncbi:DnaJ C-terminal domain-containing protein [Azonexus sp.]|jgi:molecular chaperone DnaJ|uniref:DnaJ C-terminal domain-containing protein n=1 Tax=Azonexus sp. TaxID=1872668 RepID=UPI0028186B37|nr:DnaJ C-terminal domain-containing protein [Azonexus sp.]MDR1994813.1 DnaJ domain-containing protein [Azonexus sp.]
MNGCDWSVLGLPPGADGAAVKRAYRRLAMRWHPDRNADPAATERFREIRAAYDRLLETEAADEDEAAEVAPAEPEPRPARAADIRLNLELFLEEAAVGCRKTLAYVRGKNCPTCAGSGQAGIARSRFCTACHGSGRIRAGRQGLARCPDCDGRGFFSERICPDCDGSGRQAGEVSLEVRVPPGMLTGDELRLAGQGEMATEERAAGDLYLTIVLRSHPLFRLAGRDLHAAMPVSALLLLTGGDVNLPSLAGVVRHRLEPGPLETREIRLVGRGFPGRGGNPAGDLCCELRPVFPRRLNARQRKLLAQADAALADDLAETLPEIAAWRREHLPS